MAHRKLLTRLVAALAFFVVAVQPDAADIDFRAEMRRFVVQIAAYARQTDPDFIVVPQNGHELLTLDGKPDGELARDYADSIDGQGREDLFFGYRRDDVATGREQVAWMTAFLDRALQEGIVPLVTDYCSSRAKVDESYARNRERGYVSFAAARRDLDSIPRYPSSPHEADDAPVRALGDARNFLYLIDPGAYDTAQELVTELDATSYDVFIVDAFVDDEPLSASQIQRLQTKPGGARRIVLAYMSIGEAEEYRYYWQESWNRNRPTFVERENPDWEGNYTVRYWESSWQEIILGTKRSYLDRLLAAGFDGVYLDIIDAFEYFE